MLIRLLRSYLAPYRKWIVTVVALQIVQTVATLFLPTLNADIIDKGIRAGDNGYIWSRGTVMLGAAAVQIVFAIGAIYYGSKIAMAFGRDVRKGLFRRVTAFSSQDVAHAGAPSLITRITNDVQQVQMLVLTSCTLLVAAPIMVVGGTIMAVREDLGLSVVLLISIPALIGAVTLVVRRLVPGFRLMQVRIDAVNGVLRDQISGIRVVRAFVREPHETERFREVNQNLTAASLSTGRLLATMFPVVTVVLNLSSVGVLLVGGGRINSGHLTIGALIAYLTYLALILQAVMMATFMAIMVPRAAVCAERIEEVLDSEPTMKISSTPTTVFPLRATVEFRDVGYKYPRAEHAVLSDISFTSKPGTVTAIIGSTGAGKTTLMHLVPRLFDVTAGSVLVDGVDVRELTPKMLTSRIGFVPQRPYLFTGTVATNLRYGNPAATDDELWEALEIAQATSFVTAMPGGLDAGIAAGGSNVSGGQRQRLCIARALVCKPEIFVFDDSFSALDLTTDSRLRAALQPLFATATALIVAQRVSTIISADQIVVLEDGAMVGLGTHTSLLESCPTYVEIVESQATAETNAAALA
jgi:ATP-binding cassette subfamily B multidrug efflux pump